MDRIAYIPSQVVIASVPSTPTAGYVKLYQKTDGNWYQLDDAGDETRIIPFAQCFQALKTTSEPGSANTWVDVQNWDAPTITESIYSFDTTTGVLTINDTGVFEVAAHILIDDTGNNRIEQAIKLVDSAGDVAGALDRQYSARNNGFDLGSAQFNSFYYEVTTSGETLKLQEQHIGANCNIVSARFNVKRVR
ncbi:MAG: hypothetical protein AAF223_09025 [Bacteroidota bacterium]